MTRREMIEALKRVRSLIFPFRACRDHYEGDPTCSICVERLPIRSVIDGLEAAIASLEEPERGEAVGADEMAARIIDYSVTRERLTLEYDGPTIAEMLRHWRFAEPAAPAAPLNTSCRHLGCEGPMSEWHEAGHPAERFTVECAHCHKPLHECEMVNAPPAVGQSDRLCEECGGNKQMHDVYAFPIYKDGKFIGWCTKGYRPARAEGSDG